MDNMILGRYIPGNSIVHRLDPRSKLVHVFSDCFYNPFSTFLYLWWRCLVRDGVY